MKSFIDHKEKKKTNIYIYFVVAGIFFFPALFIFCFVSLLSPSFVD